MVPGMSGAATALRVLFSAGTTIGLTDSELIDRFGSRNREVADAAFSALVERHGPMVLGVCRRLLDDRHLAEDAFQATFLILALKAKSLRHDAIGGWLRGVATRVARRSSKRVARLRVRERSLTGGFELEGPADPDPELRSVLDEELHRLPGKLASPLVLCYLESLTHEQAATRLGWPVGTVRSRLARGRQSLRVRLIRRGMGNPEEGEPEANPILIGSIPTALVRATVTSALRVSESAITALPRGIGELVEEALRSMLFGRLRSMAIGPLALGVAATIAFVPAQRAATDEKPAGLAAQAPATEKRSLLDVVQEAKASLRNYYSTIQSLSLDYVMTCNVRRDTPFGSIYRTRTLEQLARKAVEDPREASVYEEMALHYDDARVYEGKLIEAFSSLKLEVQMKTVGRNGPVSTGREVKILHNGKFFAVSGVQQIETVRSDGDASKFGTLPTDYFGLRFLGSKQQSLGRFVFDNEVRFIGMEELDGRRCAVLQIGPFKVKETPPGLEPNTWVKIWAAPSMNYLPLKYLIHRPFLERDVMPGVEKFDSEVKLSDYRPITTTEGSIIRFPFRLDCTNEATRTEILINRVELNPPVREDTFKTEIPAAYRTIEDSKIP